MGGLRVHFHARVSGFHFLLPACPLNMGSNNFEARLHDWSNGRYSSGVFAFRAKDWYPAFHSLGGSNFRGISIERRAHSFAIAALNPSDDGDWVSAYATTSVRSFILDDLHPPGWVSMIAQCLPVTLPGITLCFTGGLLDRPIELGGSLVDAVCHFDPPSLSYKEQFFCSP